VTRKDLTRTQKRRLDANNICPKCVSAIQDDEDLVFTVKRKRRCKQYIFYHERCLINEEKEKQEKTSD
jgi:hypothetical protein